MPRSYNSQAAPVRPTAHLQARREVLLRVPRDFTADERAELRALEAELQARNVLSIGIEF